MARNDRKSRLAGGIVINCRTGVIVIPLASIRCRDGYSPSEFPTIVRGLFGTIGLTDQIRFTCRVTY
jgi:hypothetical protein